MSFQDDKVHQMPNIKAENRFTPQHIIRQLWNVGKKTTEREREADR